LGIGHKLSRDRRRYVNLTDDHIRDAFNEMFAKIVPELFPGKKERLGRRSMTCHKCWKRLVRGAGFEPARRFRH